MYAISLGARTTFSSASSANCMLDSNSAWIPVNSQPGEWAQVSVDQLKYFTGVVVQGRGDQPSWVTELTVSYTKNGIVWKYVD